METQGYTPVNFVLLSHRLNFSPVGRQGEQDGSAERLFLNGEPVQRSAPFNVQGENIFILELPGGGAFGNVKLRAASLSDDPGSRVQR